MFRLFSQLKFLDPDVAKFHLLAPVALQSDEAPSWPLAHWLILPVVAVKNRQLIQIQVEGFDPVRHDNQQGALAGDLHAIPLADGFVLL